jgi:glycosyltransferase involved in cell wall biosynthesis
MGKKKITVSVISDLTTDQRVIRICTTLQEMGFSVKVIARCFTNSLPLDAYPFEAKRIRCYWQKGILQYAEFNLRLFFHLLFCKTDYFLANDLDVLVPNYTIGKIRGKALFYDTHEYFTGVPELRDSHLKRKCWKFIENQIFPKLKTVYTVNESLKNIYTKEYGNEIAVIRNVPVTTRIDQNPLPENWQHKIILLLQGAGINKGRGGLELMKAMQYLPDNYLLLFIGSGNQWDLLVKKRTEWGLENKVKLIDKLPPEKLKKYTPLAHIGFSLDSFEDLNCRFNLPNKIFDYIHAGVPVLATDIPEVDAIIKQYGVGRCFNSAEPEVIAKAVKELIEDEKAYRQYKVNCIAAARELCWEIEKDKLIAIYKPYLQPH